MEFYSIMLKNTLSVAAATIAIVASASLPALASVDSTDDFATESIPEPTTVLGLMTFAGGALLTKKRIDSQKAE